ncbi:MAG: histone deacetylase family protein [Fervidobacterium sp.]
MRKSRNNIFFCTQLNDFYVPKKEIDNGKFIRNPEKPSRLSLIENYLENNFTRIPVKDYPDDIVYTVHSEKYVSYIRKKSQEVEEEYIPEVFFVDPIFDTGTPIRRETYRAALNAVNTVMSAVEYAIQNKKPVYALTRPPGHHAMKHYGGGYCYFNNVAIGARYLEKLGMRVGILDIDFHHGNGTQDIFYDDRNVLYVSIHGDPRKFYPWYSGYENEIGTGKAKGTNLNIPLPGGSTFEVYKNALQKAFKKIIDYKPDFFILSFGTDTHINDPVGHFSLVSNDYVEIGILVSKIIEKVGNGVIVHEGGYNAKSNLSAVKNFLKGVLS